MLLSSLPVGPGMAESVKGFGTVLDRMGEAVKIRSIDDLTDLSMPLPVQTRAEKPPGPADRDADLLQGLNDKTLFSNTSSRSSDLMR